MKAKEYFEKYFANLVDLPQEKHNKNCVAFMIELSQETIALCDSRRSRSNETVDGVLKEINQKYNAVANMCEKKYKQPILIRNGFLNYWNKQFVQNNMTTVGGSSDVNNV